MKHEPTRNMKDISAYTIYKILLALSLLCILFSIIIYVENIQLSNSKQDFCSAITGTNGCETVQTSTFSKTFGISNSIYGIIGFAILGILSLILILNSEKTGQEILYLKILRFLTILGGIISGIIATIFIYLQIFVIHAYCIFCIIVDISSFILLGLAIYLLYRLIKKQ